MYYMVRGIEKLAKIKFGKVEIPNWLVNVGVAFGFFIAVGSAFVMVFVQALPVYQKLGMML